MPNAAKLFQGSAVEHLTFAEVGDRIFDPTNLVSNMLRQYLDADLSGLYRPQHILAPSLSITINHYDLLYNDFVDFAMTSSTYWYHHDLQELRTQWKLSYGENDAELLKRYTGPLMRAIFDARCDSYPKPLERYVLDWIEYVGAPIGIALLGTYGLGKSSFARRLAYLCAQAYLEDPIKRIPFLIELKEFGSHQDIRGLITHELVNRHGAPNGSFNLFQMINRAGKFVIILDGFDEMKQGMTADSLLYNFNQLTELFTSRSKILLCGRPTVFETEAEQNRVIKGELSIAVPTRARYIPVTILPFGIEDVCEFILEFTKKYHAEQQPRLRKFVRLLREEVEHDGELKSLVSRPVHLPMLVVYVTKHDVRPSDIRRADLYDTFIDAIIEREFLKRVPAFQSLYSTSERHQFARGLAVAMWINGQARTIRHSEIPSALIEKFVKFGHTIEAVRRDLVTACFLERKPPDILFVPHKSFLEFLVAEEIANRVREASATSAIDIGLEITDEVFSFLGDMLNDKEWEALILRAIGGDSITRRWVRWLGRTGGTIPAAVERRVNDELGAFPLKTREELSFFFEATEKPLSDTAIAIIGALLTDKSDMASVHAYRAAVRNKLLDRIEMSSRVQISPERLVAWLEKKWIAVADVKEEICIRYIRSKLLNIIGKREHANISKRPRRMSRSRETKAIFDRS